MAPEVRQKKAPARACGSCDHAAMNSYGVYCTLFHDWIDNEAVALDCPEFEPADPHFHP